MTRPHLPRRSGVGARQVLLPGTRKRSPHPMSMAAVEARRRQESEDDWHDAVARDMDDRWDA